MLYWPSKCHIHCHGVEEIQCPQEANHDIIITHTNKDLGPVGIDVSKYISFVMYTIVSKKQALWYDASQCGTNYYPT
jgi:hypothetical protein